MATYDNDLRLKEIATGDESGTWGTSTNLNLELIGEALGYGTQDCFATDADATTTVADGAADPARAMYFKVTSSATLTATRVLTIAPNTVSRVMFIENATTGSQSITISQGSGANVTIATGRTAVVYLDGAGSGAAVVDALALVDPGVTDTLAEVLVAGNTSGGTALQMTTTDELQFRDTALKISSSADGQLDIDADTEIEITAPTVDIDASTEVNISGALKVDTDTLVVDATNNRVGIGTSSPGVLLDIAEGTAATDAIIGLTAGTGGRAQIRSEAQADNTSSELSFYTMVSSATNERMRIDSSGNVGIGVSSLVTGSTRRVLQVSTGTDGGQIAFADSTTEAANPRIFATNKSDLKLASANSGASTIQFITGTTSPAERMRIDASGNLLVAKTGLDASVAGTEIRLNLVAITSAGDTPLYLRRNTNDGELINFKQGVTNVGSIGTVNGDLLVGTGDTGLRFHDTDNRIYPINTSGGTKVDGAIDLGDPTAQFKDLYLSGNAYADNFIGTNDTDTFIAMTGSNLMRFFTANTEKMRIDSSGNVGIGTSSPATKVEISGTGFQTLSVTSTNSSPVLKLNSAASSTAFLQWNNAGSSPLSFYDLTASAERMRIDSSGNVGIGTSSPEYVLDVDDSSGNAYIAINRATQSQGEVGFKLGGGTSGADWYIYQKTSADTLHFYKDSDLVTIDSSGNVGIGTSSPASLLDVSSAGEVVSTIRSTSTSGARGAKLRLNVASTGGDDPAGTIEFTYGTGYTVAGSIAMSHTNPAMKFLTGTTEAMRIDSSGNVGIACTPDTALNAFGYTVLEVAGANTTKSGAILLSNSSGTDFGQIYADNSDGWKFVNGQTTKSTIFYGGSGTAEQMRIDASGNLLVGTTDTTLFNNTSGGGAAFIKSGDGIRLDVARSGDVATFNRMGSTGLLLEMRQAGAVVGSVTVTASSTAYNTSSDQRLKENIVDAPSASDDIDAIQVRSFDWKSDGSHQKYGMVAQELVTVAPEAVSAPEDPEEMMGVDYSKLVPMMLKEIQQLRARVAELESK